MVAGTPVQQASPEALGPPAAPPQSVRVLHQVFYRSVGAATTSEVMVDSIITAVRSGGPGVSSNGTSSCPRAAPSRPSAKATARSAYSRSACPAKRRGHRTRKNMPPPAAARNQGRKVTTSY